MTDDKPDGADILLRQRDELAAEKHRLVVALRTAEDEASALRASLATAEGERDEALSRASSADSARIRANVRAKSLRESWRSVFARDAAAEFEAMEAAIANILTAGAGAQFDAWKQLEAAWLAVRAALSSKQSEGVCKHGAIQCTDCDHGDVARRMNRTPATAGEAKRFVSGDQVMREYVEGYQPAPTPAGVRCDTERGPCSCGAWHEPAPIPAEGECTSCNGKGGWVTGRGGVHFTCHMCNGTGYRVEG